MNKFQEIAKYLETVKPSKSYEDYERHKKALKKLIGEESNMWIEVIQELCDRMWI